MPQNGSYAAQREPIYRVYSLIIPNHRVHLVTKQVTSFSRNRGAEPSKFYDLLSCIEKYTPCVKNATKSKSTCEFNPLAGLYLSSLNNVFSRFVALLHDLKNELKMNPLKSCLFREFLACLGGFEPLAFGVGVEWLFWLNCTQSLIIACNRE